MDLLQSLNLSQDTLKVVTDTLRLVSDTTNTSATTDILKITKEIAAISASVATIIGIIVGLYFGREGLKKYLLDDHVKSKFSEIHLNNSETSEVATQIIDKIRDKEQQIDSTKVVSERDLIHVKSLSNKLYKTASGASKPVATLAYFLDQTLRNITTEKINEYSNFRYKPSAAEFYRIIFNCCKKITAYANNVVDIPDSIELEPMNDVKEKYQEFINDNNIYSIKGYDLGLDLNSNSPYSLIYANLLDRSSSKTPIFKKNFYKHFGNNIPELHLMYHQNIYFPPVLSKKDENLLGFEEKIHLIKIKNMNRTKGSGESFEMVYLYFTNLQSFFNFVDNNLSLDNLKSSYQDDFIKTGNRFQNKIENLELIGNETILIECKKDVLSDYFQNVQDEFKTKMNSLEA